MNEMLPITAPPVLWNGTHNVTNLFTWVARPDGWDINGPFELLTHYTVGGTMTAEGPMVLRCAIDGVRLAEDARRTAEYGDLLTVTVPNQYRHST